MNDALTESGPVYVTGAGGFLGSAVCELLSTRKINIIPIHRRDVDLAGDDCIERLTRLAEKTGRPFAFLHLAAVKPGKLTFSDYARDNVLATSNVLDFCEAHSVTRFVFTSTLSVYAESELEPIDESARTMPHNGYIASKLSAEHFVEAARSGKEKRFLILRLPSLYGHGQADSFIDGLARTMKESPQIELFNRGESIREVLPVSDAARAVCSALTDYSWKDSMVMNVGCGQKVSSFDFASALASMLNYVGSITPSDRFAPSFPNTVVSINSAQRHLGFSPTPWRDALAEYAKSLPTLG